MNASHQSPPLDPLSTPLQDAGLASVPFWLLVAFVLLVGALLRVPALPESLWVDELHTAWVVEDGLGEIANRARMGNQSPLYFYAVWPIRVILGRHEVSYRLLSLLAGFGLIVTAMLVARRSVGGYVAPAVAGLILAVDRDMIFFSTEARVYALIQWGVPLHLLLTLGLLRSPHRGIFLLWSITGAALFYLHYTAVLPLAVEMTLAVLLARGRTARLSFSLAGLGIFVLCLPMAWHLLEIAGARENWATFIRHDDAGEWLRWQQVLWLSAPLAAIAIIDLIWRKTPRESTWRPIPRATSGLLLVAATALLPVVLAYFLTATDTLALFFGRYLIASQTLLLVMPLVLSLMIRPGRWRVIGLIATLLLAFWMRPPQSIRALDFARWPATVQQPRQENWREAVQAVNRHLPDEPTETVVLVASGLIEADGLRREHDASLRQYALLPIRSIYRLQAKEVDAIPLAYRSPGRLSRWQVARIGNAQRVILIYRGSRARADTAAAEILQSLPATADAPGTSKPLFRSGQMQVVELQLSAADPPP
ncbi:MAG: hypothetical protein WDZ51_16525 [Pirellulaceae bacterium]